MAGSNFDKFSYKVQLGDSNSFYNHNALGYTANTIVPPTLFHSQVYSPELFEKEINRTSFPYGPTTPRTFGGDIPSEIPECFAMSENVQNLVFGSNPFCVLQRKDQGSVEISGPPENMTGANKRMASSWQNPPLAPRRKRRKLTDDCEVLDSRIRDAVEKLKAGNSFTWKGVARIVQGPGGHMACRYRWVNFLDPHLKSDPFESQELREIFETYKALKRENCTMICHVLSHQFHRGPRIIRSWVKKICVQLSLVNEACDSTSLDIIIKKLLSQQKHKKTISAVWKKHKNPDADLSNCTKQQNPERRRVRCRRKWIKSEDDQLLQLFRRHQNKRDKSTSAVDISSKAWKEIGEKMEPQRPWQSCLHRWRDHVNPDLKKGPYTEKEVLEIYNMSNYLFGEKNRWQRINLIFQRGPQHLLFLVNTINKTIQHIRSNPEYVGTEDQLVRDGISSVVSNSL